jgi:hypothetical protein
MTEQRLTIRIIDRERYATVINTGSWLLMKSVPEGCSAARRWFLRVLEKAAYLGRMLRKRLFLWHTSAGSLLA